MGLNLFPVYHKLGICEIGERDAWAPGYHLGVLWNTGFKEMTTATHGEMTLCACVKSEERVKYMGILSWRGCLANERQEKRAPGGCAVVFVDCAVYSDFERFMAA